MSLCRASSRARPPLTLDCSTRSVWPADSLIIHFSHNYRRFVVIYICANQPVMCCVYRDKSRARELKTRSRRIDADTLTGSRTSLALSTNNFSYAQPFSPHLSRSRHTRKKRTLGFFGEFFELFWIFYSRKTLRAVESLEWTRKMLKPFTLRFWQKIFAPPCRSLFFNFLSPSSRALSCSWFYAAPDARTRVVHLHTSATQHWTRSGVALMNGAVVQCLINFHYKLMWLFKSSSRRCTLAFSIHLNQGARDDLWLSKDYSSFQQVAAMQSLNILSCRWRAREHNVEFDSLAEVSWVQTIFFSCSFHCFNHRYLK